MRLSPSLTVSSSLLAAALLVLPPGIAGAADLAKPAGLDAELIEVEAKVAAIDLAKREVTLTDAQGETVVLRVGPEARNLPQLRVGDTVRSRYFRGLLFHLEPAGSGKPLRVERTVAERAPMGHKPGAAVTSYIEIVARVEGLDAANRLVTLRGPNAVVTLKVAEDLNLEGVKIGDMVKAHFSETYAIAVEAR